MSNYTVTLSPLSTSSPTVPVYQEVWHELVISGAVAVAGVLFNTLSFVYFVKRDFELLGSKLLILLNVFDLCVCTSSALIVVLELLFRMWGSQEGTALVKAMDLLLGTYVAAGESTAFSTCLLSVVRCWCLCFPFKRVNSSHLVVPTVVQVLYVLSREIGLVTVKWTCPPEYWNCELYQNYVRVRDYLTITFIATIIIIVIFSNVVSIKKVRAAKACKDLVKVARRAAVTVFLVASNFCLFTTTFLVLFCVFQNVPTRGQSTGIKFLEFMTFRVLLPMNSATNPLIYLIRKQEMREFVGECLTVVYDLVSCRRHRRLSSRSSSSGEMMTQFTKGTGNDGSASDKLVD